MATIDKIILNNQIVSMRHDVHLVKRRLIMRLIRELKKLRKKPSTDSNKQLKNVRRSDHLKEQVTFIKKLEDDEVSKFVLSNQKDPHEMLKDPRCELKAKLLAKMSMDKVMKASLYDFRKKYVNYAEQVPSLLASFGENKKAQSSARKNNNVSSPSRLHLENDSSNVVPPNKKLDSSKNIDTSRLTLSQNDNLESSSSPVRVHRAKSVKLKGDSVEKQVEVSDSEDEERSVEEQADVSDSEDEKSSVEEQADVSDFEDEKSSVVEQADVSDSEDEKNSVEKQVKISDCKPSEDKKRDNQKHIRTVDKCKKSIDKEKRAVDPFFVTTSNSAYMTLITNDRQIESFNQCQNDSLKSEDRTSEAKQRNRSASFGFDKLNSSKRFQSKNCSKPWKKNQNISKVGKTSRKQEKQFQKKQINAASEEKPLHPSWEAKRRLTSGSVSLFCGKKLKLSDE